MDNEERIPPFVQDYLNKMDYEGYPDFVKLTRDYHKEREEYPGKYAEQSAHLNSFNRTTGRNVKLNYNDGLKGIEAKYKKRAYELAKQHGFKGPDPNQPSDKEFTLQGAKFQGMIDHHRQRSQTQSQQMEQQSKAAQQKETVNAGKQENPQPNPHNPSDTKLEKTVKQEQLAHTTPQQGTTENQTLDPSNNQQSYQQEKPRVAFKEMEREQQSVPDQQTKEQQPDTAPEKEINPETSTEPQPPATDQPSREQQRAAFLEKVKQTRDQQTQRQQGNQHEV